MQILFLVTFLFFSYCGFSLKHEPFLQKVLYESTAESCDCVFGCSTSRFPVRTVAPPPVVTERYPAWLSFCPSSICTLLYVVVIEIMFGTHHFMFSEVSITNYAMVGFLAQGLGTRRSSSPEQRWFSASCAFPGARVVLLLEILEPLYKGQAREKLSQPTISKKSSTIL